MKAITIHQPWATLIAIGQKRYETRSWNTDYRGEIAIHAGRNASELTRYWRSIKDARAVKSLKHFDPFFDELAAVTFDPSESRLLADIFPRGVILATAELIDIHRNEPPNLTSRERLFGHYGAGRYAWEIANVKRLETPIPALGEQGLWDWTGKTLQPSHSFLQMGDVMAHALGVEHDDGE